MASNKKVVTIGISGSSCSGKTTLAKWLQKILPNTLIFYQDDFFKPQKDVPIDATTNLVNWDCPEAINFSDFTKTLQKLHKTGIMPTTFESKEDLNVSQEINGFEIELLIEKLSLKVNEVLGNVEKALGTQNTINKINGSSNHNFNESLDEHDNNEWCFVIVDGFLLYEDVQVIKELDIKLFTKANYETLKKRREKRNSYVTLEGYWIDPPNYFDNIVWPEYVKSYSRLLSGSKETGLAINDMIILESDNTQQIKENIEKVVTTILEFVEKNGIYNNIDNSNDKSDNKSEEINTKLSNSKSDVIESSKKNEENKNRISNEVLVYS